jgi:hypothetical protein
MTDLTISVIPTITLIGRLIFSLTLIVLSNDNSLEGSATKSSGTGLGLPIVKRIEKTVQFKGRQVKARWDEELETVIVEEMDGTRIPSSTAFAFVYPAFFGDN